MIPHYLLLKCLHIFGVILFLGNILITAFWKIFADRTRNWQIIAFSQRLVTYTDIAFTAVGILLIVVTGILLAQSYAQVWQIKWFAWGVGLFAVSGIIWVMLLIPLQIQLHRLSNQFAHLGTIPSQYWFYENLWSVFGVIASILPLGSLYFMVFKPLV